MGNLIIDAFYFVVGENMFWGSMGFTTAMAMFVGVLLYNGNIDHAKRGLFGVLSYAAMLFWTTLVRVMPNALEHNFTYNSPRPFAGLMTILLITFFWMLGVFIGVNMFKIKSFKL